MTVAVICIDLTWTKSTRRVRIPQWNPHGVFVHVLAEDLLLLPFIYNHRSANAIKQQSDGLILDQLLIYITTAITFVDFAIITSYT